MSIGLLIGFVYMFIRCFINLVLLLVLIFAQNEIEEKIVKTKGLDGSIKEEE